MIATATVKRKTTRKSLQSINTSPAVSLKEARKLLGKDYSHFSDDEVVRIVALLENIAREYIRSSVPQM